ncbi:hypothetical protein ThidrDRAFT_4509 [Thiorhodococcus drewsii AZ1]|uniref:Tetratricopeptide repeat protein n=1 Tax=Thiorhodococcus drewsii AZ1 TaxID=765913 RepID=G2E895_9GAMM|nr:hypothetical protein [Thiorhodococcus drewsii]EGV27675.1 hypothetical protein ThidrDRAFT_4509 [Thiorhodococcus drewsii AZ1]
MSAEIEALLEEADSLYERGDAAALEDAARLCERAIEISERLDPTVDAHRHILTRAHRKLGLIR